MTFGVCRGVAQDAAGNIVPNVRVEVRRMVPGFPLAIPLYADAEGATGIDNYFTSASGEWEFYVVGGFYRVRVFTVGGAYDKTWDNVPVGSAQGADINGYAGAGFTWAPESATASPPTSGCIRFNNADVSLATHIYLSKNTLGNSDVTNWITSLVANDWILFATGVGIETGWQVVSVTSHTSWFDIIINAATYTGPTGPLSFGDAGFVNMSQQKAPLTSAGTEQAITTAGSYTIGDTVGKVVVKLAAPGTVSLTLGAVAARNGLPLVISDAAANADIPIAAHSGETTAISEITAGYSATLYPSTAISGWYPG